MAFEIAPPKRDIPRASARRNDRDAVWRLCGWGSSAMLALVMLAIATQSGPGGKRIEHLFGIAPPPAAIARITPPPPAKDPETSRLQVEVRSLAADRERLVSRLAKLESHIEEVTGSIQRQETPTLAPALPATSAAALTPSLPQIATVQAAPAALPAVVAAPRAAAPAVPVIDPLAMPVVIASAAAWPDMSKDQKEEEPKRAPPLETRNVPMPPPSRLAALPAHPTVAEPARPTPARTEYGIDLGGAPNMEALRARWSTVKANLGPLLTGLQPIAVRDRRPGSTAVHLVVGPMPNIAAARQVCTRFAAARVACRPAKFDGEAVVQR